MRCIVAQGIVHTIAQQPADDVLKGAFNPEAAAAVARERLAAMETGLTIDQLALDEVSAPASVLDSLEAVTSAETDSAQWIVAAEQERARILGETAGAASGDLLAQIDAYEQAVESGRGAEAGTLVGAIDSGLDDLQIEGVSIGGDVARRINEANTHRTRVVEEVRGDRETFQQLLPKYEQHPRLVLTRLWEACRERILTGDVETF